MKDGHVLSPGMVTFELRVNDYKGDPVAAELSVALVDPAALSPRPGFDLSLLEAFYGRQQLSVSTSSSLVASAEGEPGALRFRTAVVPAAAGQILDADASTLHDSVIETSYWNPTLRTNADGVTTFELIAGKVCLLEPGCADLLRQRRRQFSGGRKDFRPAY